MLEILLPCFAVLAALGVGGVMLLDRRLTRVQERLARLDDLETLAERVRGLSTELHRKELNDRVQDKLTEVGEAQRRASAALVELQSQVAELVRGLEQRAEQRAAPPAEDISERVRRQLDASGFDQVRILSDLGQLSGRSGRVVFEARRDGVVHKGHLSLADGEVVDETSRSAYAAFP